MKNLNLLSALLMLLPGAALCNEATVAEAHSCPKDSIKPTEYVLQFLARSKEFKNNNWLDRVANHGATAKTALSEDKPEASVSANFALKNNQGAIEITSDVVHAEQYNSLSEDQMQSMRDYPKNTQEFQEDTYTACNYAGSLYLDEKNHSAKTTVTSKCTTTMPYEKFMMTYMIHMGVNPNQ